MKIYGTRFVVKFNYDGIVYSFLEVSQIPLHSAIETLEYVNHWKEVSGANDKVEILDYASFKKDESIVIKEDELIALAQQEEKAGDLRLQDQAIELDKMEAGFNHD